MSDKIKLLGLPEGAALYMQRPRWTVRYRADIDTQEKFEAYLSARRAHCVDPFEFSGVDPIH